MQGLYAIVTGGRDSASLRVAHGSRSVLEGIGMIEDGH
jgi:hypothetical protein